MEKRTFACFLFSGLMMALPCQEGGSLSAEGGSGRFFPMPGPRTEFLGLVWGPEPGVDYKLIIEMPDPSIRYSMPVVDPARGLQPLPESLMKRLRALPKRLEKKGPKR